MINLGLDELLGSNPTSGKKETKTVDPLRTSKISTGNAFLERMERYNQDKLLKERRNEELKLLKEEQIIKQNCTFRPNRKR